MRSNGSGSMQTADELGLGGIDDIMALADSKVTEGPNIMLQVMMERLYYSSALWSYLPTSSASKKACRLVIAE